MSIFEAIILGAVQGITEFLPISSSGHLVVIEKILGLRVDSLLDFDIMMHLGTLFSILIYFREDIFKLLKLLPRWFVFVYRFVISGFKDKEVLEDELHTITFLILGTIPAALVGISFGDLITVMFRSPKAVAVMMIVTGLIFLLAEQVYKRKSLFCAEPIKTLCDSSVCRVMLVGIMQAVALIPGVSRSGSTIAAGLLAGIKREEAARFSFLLGSIAIFGASILSIKDLDILESSSMLSIPALGLGLLSSFSFGLISIGFLMKYLKNHSLVVFAVYLFIFAGINLLIF